MNDTAGDHAEFVELQKITVDDAFQPRSVHLNGPMLTNYRRVIKSVDRDLERIPFPPILVANIAGKLYLLDGFHRLEAHKLECLTKILAKTIKVETVNDALWQAANANMRHGHPLTQAEKRAAFPRFIRANMHRKAHPDASPKVIAQRPSPEVMTLGEIAAAFGVGSKSTIRSWFIKHFPEEYAELYGTDEGGGSDTGGLRDSNMFAPETTAGEVCFASLRNVAEKIEELEDEEERRDVLIQFLNVGRLIAEKLGEDGVREVLERGFPPGYITPEILFANRSRR